MAVDKRERVIVGGIKYKQSLQCSDSGELKYGQAQYYHLLQENKKRPSKVGKADVKLMCAHHVPPLPFLKFSLYHICMGQQTFSSTAFSWLTQSFINFVRCNVLKPAFIPLFNIIFKFFSVCSSSPQYISDIHAKILSLADYI